MNYGGGGHGTWDIDWEWWRLVPSPVLGAGKVLICAPKGNPVYAVNVGREMADKPVLAWDSKDKKNITSDVPTPLFFMMNSFMY